MSEEMRMLNVHDGQIVYGAVKDDFQDDDENKVEIGYRPSMVHFTIFAGGEQDTILGTAKWYATEEDNLYIAEEQTGNELHHSIDDNGIVEAMEKGFIVNGGDLDSAFADDVTGFRFEAYGVEHENAKCPIQDEQHPDPVKGDTKADEAKIWRDLDDSNIDGYEQKDPETGSYHS